MGDAQLLIFPRLICGAAYSGRFIAHPTVQRRVPFQKRAVGYIYRTRSRWYARMIE